MELTVRSAEPLKVPEGPRTAKFVRYELMDTKYGKRLRMWFETGDGEVSIFVSPVLNPRSNLYKILTAMGFSLEPGTKFELDSALGKRVGLVITKNAKGYAQFAGAFAADESEVDL